MASPPSFVPLLAARRATGRSSQAHHLVRSSTMTWRSNSTQASSSSSPPTSSPTPTPPTPPRQPSRHVLFYRDILPPMLKVLGYSAGVYFALQFTYSYLDAREQSTREGDGVRGLADKVRLAREEGDRAVAVGSTSKDGGATTTTTREGEGEAKRWRSWIKLGR